MGEDSGDDAVECVAFGLTDVLAPCKRVTVDCSGDPLPIFQIYAIISEEPKETPCFYGHSLTAFPGPPYVRETVQLLRKSLFSSIFL